MASAGLLTLLFTDLVGSTALHARLGDVAADERVQRHLHAVASIVADHEGVVVKTLGDGVLATFRSARRAIACGAALQRREADEAEPLSMRVGLAAGDVIERDGDVHGLAVATAARIAALAGSGEVLASELVRQLAGPDPAVTFVERGAHTLRGVPEPVRLVAVDWDGRAVAVASETVRPRLVVGRDDELAQLRRAIESPGAVVLVAGEPGIGKTSLVETATADAIADGKLVAWGRAWDGDGAPAFWPWISVARALVQRRPDIVSSLPPVVGRRGR